MASNRTWRGTLGFIALCLIVLAGVRFWFGGVAPRPAPFAGEVSFESALAESERTGRPVLAFATADWCGPCQMFKRGALADDRVGAWIEGNAVPYYLDLTSQDDAGAQRAARQLDVSAVPTLILIREGEIAGRISGVLGAEDLLEWLQRSGGSPPPAG